MKSTSLGLIFLVACGGDPFVYQTLSEEASDVIAHEDASDDQKFGANRDASTEDAPNETRSEAATNPDADAADASDERYSDANRSEAAIDSSDAEAVWCRTAAAIVGCGGGDWSCCTGPLVNCDGSTCAGTCSGVSSLCGSPRCSLGEACLTGDGHEGVVGG